VVTLLPSEKVGIAVLTNAAPIGVPEAMSASFFELVLAGKVTKDWVKAFRQPFEELMRPAYGTPGYSRPPARKSPALALGCYAGAYRNDYFGDLEVVEKDGGLILRLGPKGTSFALGHYDRDAFLYQPMGENAGGPSGVTFLIGPDRQATRVVVENLDIHGQGTFIRVPARK
jgi:hypothetical protein